MSRDWSDRLSLVNFRCGACKAQWDGVPDLIEDAPELPHHPHRYFAHCRACGAENQPQAAWERSLLKAHQAATGLIRIRRWGKASVWRRKWRMAAARMCRQRGSKPT